MFDFQIVQDFNIRHPGLSLILYDRWPNASKLLFRYAEESDIDYDKKLGIKKPRCDLTDGRWYFSIITQQSTTLI